MDIETSDIQSCRGRRPTWMLTILALPLGLVANFFTGLGVPLERAVLALMQAGVDPSRFQEKFAGISAHLIIPMLLTLALLRATGLSKWMGINVCVIGIFLMVDVACLALMCQGLYLEYVGRSLYPHHKALVMFKSVVSPLMSAGFVLLACATCWYRVAASVRQRAKKWLGCCFREI